MNRTPSQSDYDEAIVAAVRARLPDARAIYRYGTAGGPYERPDSDLDVALLANERIVFETLNRIAVDLMRRFDRDVDVVDLRAIPVTLRVQIAADGARLYAADDSGAAEYESRAFSDYARLNEERRAILDDIRQRGSIYG